MLTRRAVLTGTAAASIAAIASAREGAVASGVGFDVGFGALTDGALAGFNKGPDSFGVFMKFQKAGAEVFFKNPAPGVVEVFQKTFFKGWTPMTSFFLKLLPSLDGAEASFLKFNKFGGEFFIKGENQVGVIMTLENGEDGVRVDVAEVDLNSD
jgi:hypothetical protein